MAAKELREVVRYLRKLVGAPSPAGVTDGQLLERFVQAHDEAAFELLVRRHERMVWGICRRLLPEPHDAEDAFQATFLVLVRKASTVAKKESVASWLYQVAYRVALRAGAKRAKLVSRERSGIDLSWVVDAHDPASPMVWQGLRPVLDQEVQRLPEKYRAPFVLCYLEEQSYQAVAQQLGLPKGTVSARLNRARELLRGRLTRRGLTLTSAMLTAAFAREVATASIPAALLASTLKAGVLRSAGQAAATMLPTRALALAEGATKAMLWTKLQITAALIVALGVVGAGAALAVKEAQNTGRPQLIALANPDDATSLSDTKNANAAVSERPNLTGTIFDKAGKPVPRAHVFVYTAAARVGVNPLCPSCYADCKKSATTGKEGAFLIRALDASLIFRVLVVCEGFEPQFVPNVDPLRGPIRVELSLFDPKQREPRQRLSGRILDPEGKPVVGAEISPVEFQTEAHRGYRPDIVDPIAVTNLGGEFLLTSKSPIESITVKVQARGLATKIFHDLTPSDSAHELRLGRGVSVTGRILRDGKPLVGIVIGLVQARRTARDFVGPMQIATDGTGRFLFSNVPPAGQGSQLQLPPYITVNPPPPDDRYYVYGIMSSLKAFGSLPTIALTVGADGTTTDVGDLRVVPGHRMSGRILLSDGKPVSPHTRVLVSRGQAWDVQMIEVGPDGWFVAEGLPTEEYTVSSFLKGYALSPKNACASLLNLGQLEGRVGRDVPDLLILYEPSKTVKQGPPDWNNPEFRKLVEEFDVRRAQLIRGVSIASGQESRPLEASPVQKAPKPIEALTQGEDLHAHLRTMLQEALQSLLEEKGIGITKNRALGECAVLQAQLGDSAPARRTLRQVKEIVQARPPTSQSEEWRNLAKACAEAGEVEELHKVLAALPDPGQGYGGSAADYRALVRQESAVALAKAGKAKEALELAKAIPGTRYTPEWVQGEVLRESTLYQVRSGDLQEARRTLKLIPDPKNKVKCLAGVLVVGGSTPTTLNLPSQPGMALLQDQAGDHAGARQTLKQALDVADAMKDLEQQAHAWAVITCAQARIGDLTGARKTLEQIPAKSKNYVYGLVAVAKGQAAAGQVKVALQTMDQLKEVSQQAFGLGQVAIGLSQTGDSKAARAAGQKALQLVLTLPEGKRRTALHVLASLRAQAKDFEGAFETASHLPGPDRHYGTLTYANIAYAQAQAGDMKGARDTLKAHVDEGDWWYERTLQGIAYLQTERGEEKQALAWINPLSRPSARGYALLGVAKGLLQRHRIDARRA